jgi:glycosyltransferase involved in cell wall biosynthesis
MICEIIGEGPERSHLAALARELGVANSIRFLGRKSRKQVAETIQRCTIFALPSRYEGLGCVYLEAMSAEKPAIACRGQGIEDIIYHGDNGWLIEPDDLHGLTDALSVLLQSPELRCRIGAAARSSILNGYTLSHQAARLAQLYRECRA